MKSDSDILAQAKKHYKDAKRGLSSQYGNIQECRAFYAGDYMEYTDKVQFATTSGQKKRATVMINRVKPTINAIKGFFAQNRRKPKYVARTNSPLQEMFSKYANALSEYARQNANADQVETQQDGDLLIDGLGFIDTDLTYGEGYASRESNGEIAMEPVDTLSCWWDPSAKQAGLIDARYVAVTKEFDLDEALSLFEDSEEEDFDVTDNDSMGSYRFAADIGAYDRIRVEWANKDEKTVKVHFYQWYDIEEYYRADNPAYMAQSEETANLLMMEMEMIAQQVDDELFDPRAEIISFNKETKSRLTEAFEEFIEAYPFKRKCFYKAVWSGDKLFKAMKSIHQDGFSLKAKTGDYDKNKKIWVGVVQSMKDPQKYYNKALTELMFVIAANSKGGVMVEENAVHDIKTFEDTYARTDAVCMVAEGALSGNKIAPKRQPHQPTGYDRIIAITDGDLTNVTGVDRAFLGSSENKLETAQLQRQRIRQVVTTLACYVDSIDLYSKEHARMMLDLLRVYAENNRGSLFRIVGESGANEFIAIAEDKLIDEYDVEIEEAPTTPEEKAEMAQSLFGIGDKLIAGGDPTGKMFYAIGVKYLPIDASDRKRAEEILNPEQKPIDPAYVQQLEDMVKQLGGIQSQAQIEKIASEVALNTAKLEEVRADTQKKVADTTKTLEEAEQTNIETQVMQKVQDPQVII